MSLIRTDRRLFGFPVWFDEDIGLNRIDLINPNGQRVSMVFTQVLDVDGGAVDDAREVSKPANTKELSTKLAASPAGAEEQP